MYINSINVNRRNFSLCISCSIYPIMYVIKHLARLTYKRVPTKGSNSFITRNLKCVIRIGEWGSCSTFFSCGRKLKLKRIILANVYFNFIFDSKIYQNDILFLFVCKNINKTFEQTITNTV